MPETPGCPTRRGLLTAIAGASLAEFALPMLRGQGVTGNRTLVCIYHLDGNDSNNMVVPLDSGRYGAYAHARGELALGQTSLLTARTTGDNEIGFHPSMPEMRDFFASKRLAVVANIGSPSGRPPVRLLDPDLAYLPGAIAAPKWAAAFTNSGSLSRREVESGSAGIRDSGGIVRLSRSGMGRSQAGTPRLSTQFPETSIGAQLRKVSDALAQSRNQAQFFFVPSTSFGTGANQLASHAAAMRNLSQALAAFYEATVELGISGNVTTYTDGVFNRTMAPTARACSTPAWAGHQLVIGDAVVGAQIYGAFPDFALGGPDDAGKTGIWIPAIAKAQYHATLARWAGVPDWEVRRIFQESPGVSQPDLGFLA
jgi:uncharacterized protein (DUF1501 family)